MAFKDGNHKKLKTWQVVTILVVASLFVIATVILCTFYKDAIFTNNTLAIVLLCIAFLVFLGATIIGWKYFNGK